MLYPLEWPQLEQKLKLIKQISSRRDLRKESKLDQVLAYQLVSLNSGLDSCLGDLGNRDE